MTTAAQLRFQPASLETIARAPGRPAHAASAPEPVVRVILHSIGMAKYRVPVFTELSRREGIDLEVYYTPHPMIQNVSPPPPPEGFRSRVVNLYRVWNRPMLFMQPSRLGSVRDSPSRGGGGPHVVVLPWDVRYLSLVPTILRASANGIGVVLWGHGYSKNPTPGRDYLRNQVGRLADAVVLYDKGAIDKIVDGGIDAERVFVAPNSIDQAPVQAARHAWVSELGRLDAFRVAHGLDSGPVLLFIARLVPERRVDVMLRAMAMLSAEMPDLQGVIIGEGPDAGRLRALARELRIAEVDRDGAPVTSSGGRQRIRLLGPMYQELDLAPWFLAADAMCFPSHLGLSLLHAFGYGLPVITSDDPLLHGPEFAALHDGVNGKLFQPNDPRSLAEALRWVLGGSINPALPGSDPDRQRRLSDNALRAAIEEFSVPRMVDGLVEAIRFAARSARAERH